MLLFGVAYYKGQIFDPWSWANSRDKYGQEGLGGCGANNSERPTDAHKGDGQDSEASVSSWDT